jgi:hypothetical protein
MQITLNAFVQKIVKNSVHIINSEDLKCPSAQQSDDPNVETIDIKFNQ